MSLRVAFRVDASPSIGTGHFMRCLTLASAVQELRGDVRFVSRGLPAELAAVLRQRGLRLVSLRDDAGSGASGDLAHSSWLPCTQGEDARDTMAALQDGDWDWLVVDHYALDARWESMLRSVAPRILAIDDLADRRHDCDALLDANQYEDMLSRYAENVPPQCRMLLGPRYALLRPEFAELRNRLDRRPGDVKRVLVSFGGVDARNFTGKAIEALKALGQPAIAVDVVIGSMHPKRPEIEAACAALGFACHVQTLDMARLVAHADLAISAGGTNLWERCCLGLPSFTISTAENQQKQVADAAAAGLVYAPQLAGEEGDLIRRHTAALIENPSLLRLLSSNGVAFVDGLGVQRCVAEMRTPVTAANDAPVTIRPAVREDGAIVWPWRNDPSTRRHSFDELPICLEDHLNWWANSLASAQRVLLIGERASRAIGVLRFDFEGGGVTRVSIYLDPAMTGRGMGRPFILAGLDWLRRHQPGANTAKAEILAANLASLKVFQAAGFAEECKVLTRTI